MNENNSSDLNYSEKQVGILLATEQLISENGYAGTSVRDIANAAGVNVAMISYYFGSKEKLLEALFAYRIGSSRVVLLNLVENKELDAFQKMEILISSYVDKMVDNRSFYQILSREPAIKELPEVSVLLSSTKQENMKLVAQLIEEGRADKKFTAEVDLPLMMNSLFGSLTNVAANCDFLRRQYTTPNTTSEAFWEDMRTRLKKHLYQLFISALTTSNA